MPDETIDEREAKTIWNNNVIPVALRRGGSQPIRLRLPFKNDNREWLKNGKRKKEPEWDRDKKFWQLPASRFNEIVGMMLERFGRLYILQPYREKEICAPACMNAEGHECECSCMGANHGIAHHGGWIEVSETFAVRYGERQLACRLMHKKE